VRTAGTGTGVSWNMARYHHVMRKLIVSNFQTLDGYYESANKTFDRFFDYFLEDYGKNEAFDEYNTELLRDADTLLLSGRTSFMANKRLLGVLSGHPGWRYRDPARVRGAHSSQGKVRRLQHDRP
jgi:hypothetical protein